MKINLLHLIPSNFLPIRERFYFKHAHRRHAFFISAAAFSTPVSGGDCACRYNVQAWNLKTHNLLENYFFSLPDDNIFSRALRAQIIRCPVITGKGHTAIQSRNCCPVRGKIYFFEQVAASRFFARQPLEANTFFCFVLFHGLHDPFFEKSCLNCTSLFHRISNSA